MTQREKIEWGPWISGQEFLRLVTTFRQNSAMDCASPVALLPEITAAVKA